MPKVLAGGEAFKYWAAVILRLSKHSVTKDDPITREEGLKIGYIIKKNHCTPGAKRQYCKGEYYVRFGEGVDEIAPSIGIGIEEGIIQRHGAWLHWIKNGELYHKFKSKADFCETMKNDEELWEEYYALIQGKEPEENLTDEEIAEIEEENQKIQEKGDALVAEIEQEEVEEAKEGA